MSISRWMEVKKQSELERKDILEFVHEIDCWDLFLYDVPRKTGCI